VCESPSGLGVAERRGAPRRTTWDDAHPVRPEAREQATPDQTFLFADLAGYTALAEAHGDELAADTAADFVVTARELLADADAEEIKSLGDGLMLRAPDATRAVRLGARAWPPTPWATVRSPSVWACTPAPPYNPMATGSERQSTSQHG
jgi:class 3 adenylate cyclase